MAQTKKFDVKYGITVDGLPFVDEKRNVTVNDLTVRGVSTVVDTRTITSVDPIITLGDSGKQYTAESIIAGTPGRIKFALEDFDDIAVGDAVKYELGAGGTLPTGLTSGNIYYVISKDSSVTSSNYRTITISGTQGGVAIAITSAGSGSQKFTLNPLRDLDQDLGIQFNYVDTTPKKGFFGYKDLTNNFTFLLDATYNGSSTQSDVSSPRPDFTGTKGGIEVKYAKLEPSAALTASSPALDIDQTWNNAAIAFKAFEMDITDTASDASSNLIDIAVGNNQKLLLRKDGALSVNSSAYNGTLTIDQGLIATTKLIAGTAVWSDANSIFYGIDISVMNSAYAAGSKLIKLSGGNNRTFSVDITGEIDSEQTWNSSSTIFTGIDLQVTETDFQAGSKLVNFYGSPNRYFSVDAYGKTDSKIEFTGGTLQTAAKVNVIDTSSAANSLLLDLQVSGASKFSIDKDGDVIASTASFKDSVDIQAQPNGSGTYEDNTRIQTSYVTIAAGTATATTVNTFDRTQYVTGKYLVQMRQGVNYHTAEVLLIHDGTVAYLTEYAAVWNSSILGTLDATISGDNVNLTFTATAATVAANAQVQVRIARVSMTD
jgi:hypothetical protein